MKVKIIGAGSIGNHLAHACRKMNWEVLVCDIAQPALDRMRHDIYPGRYGKWDKGIELKLAGEVERGGFDLICIGTPPEHHVSLAIKALEEFPKAIQVEKPLCPPDCEGLDELVRLSTEKNIPIFIGYDHVVSEASEALTKRIRTRELGDVLYLDAEFREHWAGIFNAHHWLAGPEDSYLGYWQKGGGAGGEHSHALNLWQYFVSVCEGGDVTDIQATIDLVEDGKISYDRTFALQMKTGSGLQGRVIQDVVTNPTRKAIVVTCENGRYEWMVNCNPQGDALFIYRPGEETEMIEFPKTRPDDFIREFRHIAHCLETGEVSPISLDAGVKTMEILKRAYQTVSAS